MRKHIDFILILAFFVIPPIFSSGGASSLSPAAPFLTLLLQAGVCAYILCKNKFVSEVNEACEKPPVQTDSELVSVCAHRVCTPKVSTPRVCKLRVCAVFAAGTLLTFCMLIANSFAWNAATAFFGANKANHTNLSEITKIMPEGAAETAYSVVSLLVAALYEELLYRRFLPDEAKSFLPPSLKLRIVAEILIIAVFALGHRYLGGWAVLNAFTAGCILRFFCVRTGSVVPGFLAHFAYNVIMFFVF